MEDLKNGLTGFGLFAAVVWLVWGFIYFVLWATGTPWWPFWGIVSLGAWGLLILYGMVLLFIMWGEGWRNQ